jgi:hypothetical protein
LEADQIGCSQHHHRSVGTLVLLIHDQGLDQMGLAGPAGAVEHQLMRLVLGAKPLHRKPCRSILGQHHEA